jgi:hypothetical protein
LRLTPRNYSPSVLGKIVRSCAREPSFEGAAEVLQDLAELTISGRQAGRIAHEVGQQLKAQRDQQVEQFEAGKLKPRVETRAALAVVGVDGGRLQIRSEGEGPGSHDPSWREDKIGLLATATITVSDSDPEPDLPECFRDQRWVEKLLRGISGQGPMSPADPQADAPADSAPEAGDEPASPRKRPELLVRTYVVSTRTIDEFGPMVAAEAQSRNLMSAAHTAFLGDGSAWIWKLQQERFPTFQAIVDFLHAMGHVYAAAKAAETEIEKRWRLFQEWAEACWKGRVGEVIEQLRALRDAQGSWEEAEVKALADDEPRKLLHQELGYLEHNQKRMDYPRYRQEGLPWTTSHVESTVKIFNRRVKGSEKFWSETGAEAILQLRAAFLSEDDHLDRHLKNRPIDPFRTYKTREDSEAA